MAGRSSRSRAAAAFAAMNPNASPSESAASAADFAASSHARSPVSAPSRPAASANATFAGIGRRR